MGKILLSILFAIILGCITWLVIGEKFPTGDEVKWPPLNNIVIYVGFLVIPIYLIIFFLG